MSALEFVFVDVFTEAALEGNQLGVFVDGSGLSDDQMQRLAREVNYSESTFVLPPNRGGDARMRIFTPAQELPFAGHPTLGTAMVLAELRGLDVVRLETGNGIVPVRFEERDGRRFGRMEQPLPTVESFDREADVLAALGVERSELPVELYDNGVRHVFVVLPGEDAVASLRPDQGGLADLGPVGVNCIAGSGRRWKSRMFGPGVGVAEDPATGSAAGPLAVHLARHGRIGWSDEIEIRQGVEICRPSTLHARAEGGPGGAKRVEVGGSAVIVARGTYTV